MQPETAVAPIPDSQNVFISAAAGEEEVLAVPPTIDGLDVKRYLTEIAGRHGLLVDPEVALKETERLFSAIDQPIVRGIVLEALAQRSPVQFYCPAVRAKFFAALQPYAADPEVLNLGIETLMGGDEQPETIQAIEKILKQVDLSEFPACQEKLHNWLLLNIAQALPATLPPTLAAGFRVAGGDVEEGAISKSLVAAALHSYRRFHEETGYVEALKCLGTPKCMRTLREMAEETIYPYMHESGPAHPPGTCETALLLDIGAAVTGGVLGGVATFHFASHLPFAVFLGALGGLVGFTRTSDYLTHRYIMDRPTRKGLNPVQSAKAREFLEKPGD
ncbi:MAG: hypothetical protein K1X83_06980 [Oligoflexia bacterium]|nr:hypothetical protein [Oligoflexia bacterium]